MSGRGARAWFSRGVLLLLGLLFGLISAEVLLRLYFVAVPAPSDAPYLAEAMADYIRRPTREGEAVANPDDRINSLGFRDREPMDPKSETSFRILGIGDSFVFSLVPLEENFLRVAERELDEAIERPFDQAEMIFMGMGAWSPENEVGALESIGLRLDADFALLNFFVGNDVTDIPLKGKVLRGRLYYVGSPYPALNLLRKSMVYTLVERNLLYRLRDRLVERHVDARVETTRELIIPDSRDSKAALPSHYLHHQLKRLPVYEADSDSRMEKLWGRAEKAIERFDSLCRGANLPWALHLIPSEIQVDRQVRQRVLEALGRDAADYDFDHPQKRLRAFAESRGIRVVDPMAKMRQAHSPADPLYIQFDTHWNARGNRIAGEILADSLLSWIIQ